MRKQDLIKRFYKKLIIKDLFDCWEWKSSKNADGYGLFSVGHHGSKKAHRIMYELNNGSIPNNMFVLHKCNNPSCCNPSHLYLGTNQDNMNDMIISGRSCRGIRHHNARLNEKQVLEIRTKYIDGISYKDLSILYEVSIGHIKDICHKRKWKHI